MDKKLKDLDSIDRAWIRGEEMTRKRTKKETPTEELKEEKEKEISKETKKPKLGKENMKNLRN